eukprot:scaffold526495_cov13-Prasinocladus_malaysianus.AAC.1
MACHFVRSVQSWGKSNREPSKHRVPWIFFLIAWHADVSSRPAVSFKAECVVQRTVMMVLWQDSVMTVTYEITARDPVALSKRRLTNPYAIEQSC